MTTAVVTVDRLAPYKEIACLLAEHRVSSLPVLAEGMPLGPRLDAALFRLTQPGYARRFALPSD
jgi:CBS domain-containing protein